MLLKGAGVPPKDTVKLLLAHGYELKSHSLAEVRKAIEANSVLELHWEHKSKADKDGSDTCWTRCMQKEAVPAMSALLRLPTT